MTFTDHTNFNKLESRVNISVPFSKVDTDRRMVHGFATLDNVDSQDDIVLFDASVTAFKRFRGNIREMHDLKAVGKMVTFQPRSLYDVVQDKTFSGIFVSTYVSKGAQDTWEKVLDETLTGFSIGGEIIKSRSEFNEELGRVVRIIEEYEITELSLVDNPANQLANVVSFEKGHDPGYLSKTRSENVFFCRTHNVVQFSDSPVAECHQCGVSMCNIGFVESDDPGKGSVVKALLSHMRNVPTQGDTVEFAEGFGQIESVHTNGEIMIPEDENTIVATESDPVVVIDVFAKNNDTMIKTNHRIIKNLSNVTRMKEVEMVDGNVESVDADKTVADSVESGVVVAEGMPANTITAESVPQAVDPSVEQAEVAPEESTQAADPADVEPEPAEEIKKSEIAEVKEALESMTKALAELVGGFKSVMDVASNATRSAEEAGEVAKAANAELAKAQATNQELGQRIERMENATAVRKSADVGDIVQTAPREQSIWGGHFLDGSTNARESRR